MIAFSCSHCGKKLQVRDAVAGKRAKCPSCAKIVPIPAGAAVALADPPQPTDDDTLGDVRAAPPEDTLSPGPAGDGGPADFDILEPSQTVKEIGRLGGYRVLKVLGAGAMGVVFLAEDPGLERLVALKAMKPALAVSESARQRFLREARAAAKIKHDHIVCIYQVGAARGAPFLAMELLEGESLDDRLKREGRLPPAEVLRIGREVADGLAAAHERGLIHRDIKPGNLWLEGKRGRVKILDFGLARATADDLHLTQSGAIVGTPAFMAPEQARAEAVDARCDLFSLGCVLYRACTGELPFKGKDQMSMILALATTDPLPPHQINPDVSADLSALILRLLAKDRKQRPASAAAVVEALRDIETGATIVNPPLAAKQPLLRRKRRWWPFVAAGAVALVGLALACVLYLWPKKDTIKGSEAQLKDTHPTPLDKPMWKGASDEWVRHVAAMRPDAQVEAVSQKMKEVNTGFDGKLATQPDKTGAIWKVAFVSANVTDLTPLRAFVDLRVLHCTGPSKLSDLSPLQHLKLTVLNCNDTAVSDLSPLKDMPLNALMIRNTPVTNLAVLKGRPLISLDCVDTAVTDLSPLTDTPLEALLCDFRPDRDTKVLRSLKTLKFLNGVEVKEFWENEERRQTDFDTWLRGVLALKPAERDVAALNKFKELNPDFKGTFHSKSQAAGMTDLEIITGDVVNSAGVTNLAPLQALTNLNAFYCNGPSKLSDLSPLKNLKLIVIDCSDTAVSDLAALKDMPLQAVVLRNAPVMDLAVLKGKPLTLVDCVGTLVTDLSPLKESPLQHLSCDFKLERDAEILRTIESLKTINGKPKAELLKDDK